MNELFKKISREKMTAEEKQTGFNRLQAFIQQNPVSTPWYTNVGNKIVSPFQKNGFQVHHKLLASAFALVLLISATGGTSIAAKYSIPGDILYPIKINVNEKVETFAAMSPEAKATVEASHINERLTEAEKLSSENKLNDGIKTQLETQFTQDLQSTMVHVNTLTSKGEVRSAKKVKTNIENSLQKHKVVVDQILKKKETRQEPIAPKAMMRTQTLPPDSDVNVSTFSAIEATATATDTNTATTTQANMRMEIQKQSVEESDDDKTPLLDETLNRILDSRESKDN